MHGNILPYYFVNRNMLLKCHLELYGLKSFRDIGISIRQKGLSNRLTKNIMFLSLYTLHLAKSQHLIYV